MPCLSLMFFNLCYSFPFQFFFYHIYAYFKNFTWCTFGDFDTFHGLFLYAIYQHPPCWWCIYITLIAGCSCYALLSYNVVHHYHWCDGCTHIVKWWWWVYNKFILSLYDCTLRVKADRSELPTYKIYLVI
jgi:hypothetical protein